MTFVRTALLFGLLATGCQTSTPSTSSAAAGSAASTTPNAELRNTRWVLRMLNGQTVPPPVNAEPYLLLRSNELFAEGNGSCNRFRGPFEMPTDGQLRFGALLSTRMACVGPEGNTTESGFMQALTNTRSYRISGDTLRLFGESTAQPTAVLHAVYLK